MRPFLALSLTASILFAATAFAQEVVLPEDVPVPNESPVSEQSAPSADETVEDRPEAEGQESEAPEPDAQELGADDSAAEMDPLPDTLPQSEAAPLPSPRPTTGKLLPPVPKSESEPRPVVPEPEPEPERKTAKPAKPAKPPKPAGMPEEERACRVRLTELGVSFAEYPPQSEPDGCEMAHPLTVSSLGGGVALEPDAVINCATAEANARFVRDHVQREAKRHLESRVSAVNQVSGYVCRPRNGTRTLSEHAFGNALDWGSVTLDDGENLVVKAYRRGSPEATFLGAIRKRACGPFKTVLGPGTDADHADHLHFDLAERSNGSTYCR